MLIEISENILAKNIVKSCLYLFEVPFITSCLVYNVVPKINNIIKLELGNVTVS